MVQINVDQNRNIPGDNGNNRYWFQTKANHSSAKTPFGLFKDFEIPNSLKLVDDTVRKYYKMA